MKIPRKKKKQIPEGPYCYKCLKYDKETFSMKVKYCSNLISIKTSNIPEQFQTEIDKQYPDTIINWCKLLKSEIFDDVKDCSINCKYRKY